ncbi:MAG: preprotein translocase subunit SecE [Tepidisphaeraceae bacterium]
MDAVTKKMDPQAPDDDSSDEQEERSPKARPAAAVVPASQGYFTIYKKGQGYWTRMGTVAGVALLGLLTGAFIFDQMESFGAEVSFQNFLSKLNLGGSRASYLLVLIFATVYSLFAFHVLNKPTNVDFLIATDSEMKKVNWTSKKELFGSTRVVIIFMVFVATVLFLYDLFFHTLFWWIGVLKTPPPFWPFHH